MLLWPSLSLCTLFGPPLLKRNFDVPRNTLKIPIYLYRSQAYILHVHVACPTMTLIHREMCPKIKYFGVFLIVSWITWPLAFPIPRNAPNRPFTSYWRAIYWAPWIHWRRRIEESKETIVHLCLIHTCLRLHPLFLVSIQCCSSQDFLCIGICFLN